MKVPECDRCLFYAHQPDLVCAVHPSGSSTETCPDFRAIKEEEELWAPEGYSWYDGYLIANRLSRYTQEEQLQIIDTHPLFTGVCPNCGHRYDKSSPPAVHWDCPTCGWVDDSV